MRNEHQHEINACKMYLFRLEVLLAHLGERTMHKSPLPTVNTMPGQVDLPAFLLICFSSPKHVIHSVGTETYPEPKQVK